MFIDSLDPGWQKFFKDRLIEEKRSVDLSYMFAAADVSSLLEKGDIVAAHDKALVFIHSLLERGELKVRWMVQKQIRPKYFSTMKTIFYHNADEAVTDIRNAWNSINKEDWDVFQTTVEFTLPTTDWCTIP